MTPHLTDEQRRAIDEARGNGPATVVDPSTNAKYVLLREDVYQRYRALYEEDAFEIREAYPLVDEVARREGWDDPEMEAYDQLDPRRQP